jgi:hypothetical protein
LGVFFLSSRLPVQIRAPPLCPMGPGLRPNRFVFGPNRSGFRETRRGFAKAGFGRKGSLEERPPEERSNEVPETSARGACADIALRDVEITDFGISVRPWIGYSADFCWRPRRASTGRRSSGERTRSTLSLAPLLSDQLCLVALNALSAGGRRGSRGWISASEKPCALGMRLRAIHRAPLPADATFAA